MLSQPFQAVYRDVPECLGMQKIWGTLSLTHTGQEGQVSSKWQSKINNKLKVEMKITIKAIKKGTWCLWNEEMNEPMWLFFHLHRNKSPWMTNHQTSKAGSESISRPVTVTVRSRHVQPSIVRCSSRLDSTVLSSVTSPRSLSQRLPLTV